MRKLIITTTLLLGSVLTFAQGDDCASATDIGSTPTPGACGTGNTLTYNGTTAGATAENPYSSLTCMDAPAADVWVSFTATGNEVDLSFTSGLGDANIGIYTGTCGALTGLFCESSNNGNINTTLTPMVPGDTYIMQISGQKRYRFRQLYT